MCVPTRTYLTFNNDKPWFSTKLKQLRLAKEDAYRSGDKALYKQAKYTLNREIRVAKKNYAGKLKKQLSSNDPTSVWKGLKAITSYKTPPPSTEANQQLTEDLNSFYCRFQKQKPGLTPHTHSDHPTTQPSTPSPSPSPTVSQPVIKICEEDVSKVFRRQKIRKAKGQTVSLQPASKPVLFSYHPSSHWSSIDHWSCVKSPPASNAPPSSLYPRNQKSQDLMTTDLLL